MAKSDTSIAVLSKREARDLCDKIVERAEDLHDMLKRLRDEKGWIALGYATWAECSETEFGYSKSHANRLIKAKEIQEQVTPIGVTLPESQARELGKVPEDKREEVLLKATDDAGGKPLTAKTIKAAAHEVMRPDDPPGDVIDCESEPDDADDCEQPEPAANTQTRWLKTSALELSVAAGSVELVADFLDGVATLVNEAEPSVVAAMLENTAVGLRE